MTFQPDKEPSQFYPKETKLISIALIMHTGKTLVSTTVEIKLHHRHTFSSVASITYILRS
jgi:hypothetical protein